MKRCLQLARYGESYVSPNPMVGAVIVHAGNIIGEGYHQAYGQPHAEPNAINSVKDQTLLAQSTMYVTLEPCSHYGKTPPCADLIIKYKIPKVVIGMKDPNPKVAGNGIKKLLDAGVNVTVGVLENECSVLNKHFLTFQEKKRPYIALKWAQTSDGFIDIKRESAEIAPLKISNELTKILVHKQRAQNQAIMVGTNTALLDNPTLTVRNWSGRNPVRIVIDKSGRIPENYHLLNDNIKTLVYTEQEKESKENVEFITVRFDNDLLENLIQNIYEHNINSVLVEGGASFLQSFIDKGLWDEVSVEVSPMIIGDGLKAPVLGCISDSVKEFEEHRIYKYIHKTTPNP